MLKFFAKILASKVGQILIDIALSGVGKVLTDLLDTTKNSMDSAENIGNYIRANIDLLDYAQIKQNIKTIFSYDIEDSVLDKFKNSLELKGLGKFTIAFNMIKDKMKLKGKDYEDYIINFAIEMVFIKMFK